MRPNRSDTAVATSSRTAASDDQRNEGESSERVASPVPEYAFLVSSGAPTLIAGADRRTIRRAVMKNFFRQKKAQSTQREIPRSQIISAEVVDRKGKLNGRWRLAKTSVKSAAWSGSQGASEKQLALYPTLSESIPCNSSGQEGLVELEYSGQPYYWSRDPSTPEITADKGLTFAPLSPGIPRFYDHRFDPFANLPIPEGSRTDRLMHHYFNKYHMNSLAINVSSGWWSFVSRDPALLNIYLAAVALHDVYFSNDPDSMVDVLWHKTHAIRAINEYVANTNSTAPDNVIACIGTLASVENFSGNFAVANTHIGPFYKLVESRGGIEAFRLFDALWRAFAWIDFHHSTIIGRRPSLSFIVLESPPMPEEVLTTAATQTPISLLTVFVHGPVLYDMFIRMNRLALGSSATWSSDVERVVLANLIYEIEYCLLSIPVSTERMEEFPDSQSVNEAQSLSVGEAITVAAHIVLHKVFRKIPLRTPVYGVMLERIDHALDCYDSDLNEIWRHDGNLDLLIWVIFVVADAAIGGQRAQYTWYVSRLKKLLLRVGIEEKVELEAALKRVFGPSDWLDISSAEVWHHMLRTNIEGTDVAIDPGHSVDDRFDTSGSLVTQNSSQSDIFY